MATYFVRLILFLSSYSPLFVILGVRHYAVHRIPALLLFALAAASVLTLAVYLNLASQLSSYSLDIKTVRSRDGDAMSYVVTYIIPFLDIHLNEVPDIISVIILLAVLALVYTNSNLIYMNPILNLAGHHIFDVESKTGKQVAIITMRDVISSDSNLSVVSLGDYVALERRHDRERSSKGPR